MKIHHTHNTLHFLVISFNLKKLNHSFANEIKRTVTVIRITPGSCPSISFSKKSQNVVIITPIPMLTVAMKDGIGPFQFRVILGMDANSLVSGAGCFGEIITEYYILIFIYVSIPSCQK